MKKLILLFGITMLVGATTVQQASAQVSTAPVTVTIDLTAPVISITLGADPNVLFTYATAEDYTTPQVVPKTGHFTVVSNQDYEVSVVAQGEFTVNAANDEPIPLDVVQVTVDPSTTGAGTTTMVPLSTTASEATVLATDAPATAGTVYNINYTIPDATPLLDKFAQAYATTVVYTATQL